MGPMTPDQPDDARRDKVLRSLHPDRVRERERRRRWAWVAVFLALAVGSYAGGIRALAAAAWGLAAFAALLCILCGCTFVALLCVAAAKDLAEWSRRDRSRRR